MLTRYGYTAITAASGTEAIRFFENWPDVQVDLLLVDFKLPDMDGAEAVKRIHELRPDVPVLYFSAYSESELPRPIYARGVSFIAKPFTSQQLISKIREVLDAGKAESASAE